MAILLSCFLLDITSDTAISMLVDLIIANILTVNVICSPFRWQESFRGCEVEYLRGEMSGRNERKTKIIHSDEGLSFTVFLFQGTDQVKQIR